MIKFFRKIRQNLLSDGKTGKYFKYAIGEIVLVMVGILLAVQVNNWNIDKNNSKQEVALLSQLENEYEENLKEVNEKIEMRFAILSSINELFSYIDNGIEGVPLDTIRLHITRTFKNPTFDGPDGVIQEILNSGKLYLIQNPELKIHLSNWKNTVQKVVEEEQLLVTHNTTYYYEYCRQNFNQRKMRGNSSEDELMNVYRLSDNKTTDDFKITGENSESEYRKYLNDITISNYLLWSNAYCRNANIQSIGLKEKIEQILGIIRTELKNKSE
ncbi:DUF6090 family protein [Algoriphagus pacificus]|uniref:Uncharacterized protein n=1 Tax=Algoriphagus pacificus TaxID=2811234 RepID=A0ABS3CDH4_9BACT|nr:DUF6090 family protein [Algoriphagus pacificus]MBN7815166.1 hypothetical protein [Algoriphagus pacificus]